MVIRSGIMKTRKNTPMQDREEANDYRNAKDDNSKAPATVTVTVTVTAVAVATAAAGTAEEQRSLE